MAAPTIPRRAAELKCRAGPSKKEMKDDGTRFPPTHGEKSKSKLSRVTHFMRKHEGFHSRWEPKRLGNSAAFRELLCAGRDWNRGFAVVLGLKILLDSAQFRKMFRGGAKFHSDSEIGEIGNE